ncbi:MAG: hypothetical protein DRG40_00970 [Deltaproteobacteria bacterium]|nr:MAG: hypothetical protein DRG40_00970 [Deltaproteobacteria bacterium]
MLDSDYKKAIASLAFIKVNWDRYRYDYIDLFLPFIATLFVKNKYEFVEELPDEIKRLTKDFKNEFGLEIPYHPMITILNRARKRGLIKKEQQKFFPTEKIYEYDFTDKAQEQSRKYEKIIDFLIKFSQEKYNKKIDRKTAEEAILDYLKHHDLDILFAGYRNSVLPEVGKISNENIFIFCKFVEHSYKKEPEIFSSFLDIVIGHILANVILYSDEFNNFASPKLRNLNLYLDTRFIFRLLGIEEEVIQSAYLELLKELKEEQVNLFIFHHTYDEILGILKGCEYWIENPAYDPSKASLACKFFKAKGYKQSNIRLFINQLDRKLKKYGINVIDSPEPSKDTIYQIDEAKLNKVIVETYKSYNPGFEELEKTFTIQKDIQSISSIYKLRKGNKPLNVKQAKYIFITTNTALACAVKDFEKQEFENNFYVPACVTDTFIGTLIWLRNPKKVEIINTKKSLLMFILP